MHIFKKPYWISGTVSTLIGNGIGRFGYITLMPLLIKNSWVSSFEAAHLGVAALIGYLLGPVFINLNKNYFSNIKLIRIALILCSIGYLMCSFKYLGFYWLYVWRLLTGFGGAILMVLSPVLILPIYSKNKRGLISGLVFCGIGIGAFISGLLIPFLFNNFGLAFTWIFLGIICLLLTSLIWNNWIVYEVSAFDTEMRAEKKYYKSTTTWLLFLSYSLNAIGYLPHTLFWVDFLVRQMNKSLPFGGASWALFGLGALIGPLISGRIADLMGFKNSILLAFFLKSFAVLMPALFNVDFFFHLSSFIVGFFTPGLVSLISGYSLHIFGKNIYKHVWNNLTFLFSLSQAIGGFVMAFFIKNDNYIPLFRFSSLALLISFLCILIIKKKHV